MGFDACAVKFLLGENRRGIVFGKTLTLGHQAIYMDHIEYAHLMKSFGMRTKRRDYSDEFLADMGCSELMIMDASAYEGASLIHDLNDPIPPSMLQSFNCVIDGGTLEHVFNFPTAIRNCMEMVKLDGVLILMTPWHNYSGHGLYQFSPELFYSVLSEANGFKIERILISVRNKWYNVLDPAVFRSRVEIATPEPVMLHITARRIDAEPIFVTWPQQSDYMAVWRSAHGSTDVSAPFEKRTIKDMIVGRITSLRRLQSTWRMLKRRRSLDPKRNRALEHVRDQDGVPL
jgi:hypothetical protein